MTGRERILATLSRQPADCIPFDLGGTDCSSIHVLTYNIAGPSWAASGTVAAVCQLVAEMDRDIQDASGSLECLFLAPCKVWKTPFRPELSPARFSVEDRRLSVVRNKAGFDDRAGATPISIHAGTPLAGVLMPPLDAFRSAVRSLGLFLRVRRTLGRTGRPGPTKV